MTLVNAYTTIAALKARLGNIPDGNDDAVLEQVINAASRLVDGMTNRRFYDVTETRYFSPIHAGLVAIDEATAITEVMTDPDGDGVYETTWDADQFQLGPLNALTTGRAYSFIAAVKPWTVTFPVWPASVAVAGTWGFSAPPPEIEEACLLLAVRLFQRKHAPYGIAGSTDLGQVQFIPRTDPDVAALLKPWTRTELVV